MVIVLQTIKITREKPAATTSWAIISKQQQGIYYMHHSTNGNMAFAIPIMENGLEWEIAQWVHYVGLILWSTKCWVDTLYVIISLVAYNEHDLSYKTHFAFITY